MRIVFLGTPVFADIILSVLIDSKAQITGVVTQPDRPKGRKHKLAPPPVKETALKHAIPLIQPEKLNTKTTRESIVSWRPDVLIVAAYGKILRKKMLNLAPLGAINIHASLLPRWRGASPVQQAIISGDEQTGATLMQMDEGLDTGPALATQKTLITPDDTGETLENRLAAMGAKLLLENLGAIENKKLTPVKQNNNLATYAPIIKKSDGKIDFSQPAAKISRMVRAFLPWPAAHSILNGEMIKFHKTGFIDGNESGFKPGEIITADKLGIVVQCGQGRLVVEKLQLAGRKMLDAKSFLTGNNIKSGDCFD